MVAKFFFEKKAALTAFSSFLSLFFHLSLFFTLHQSGLYTKKNQPNVANHTNRQKILEVVFATQKKEIFSYNIVHKEIKQEEVIIENPVVPDCADRLEKTFSPESISTKKYFPQTSLKHCPDICFTTSLSALFPIEVPDLFLEESAEKTAEIYTPQINTRTIPLETSALVTIKNTPPQYTYKQVPVLHHTTKQNIPQSKDATYKSSVASLNRFAQEENLETVSWSDAFVTEVNYYEKSDGKIIFAVTFLPKRGVEFNKLPQNIYYLLDTSNAIQSSRLQATKNAIIRSLSYLTKKDTFNILTFDNKIQRLSPNNLIPCVENQKKAFDFLQQIKLGSLFSSSNPQKALHSLLYENCSLNSSCVIVLITNGDGLGKQKQTENLIRQFCQQNQGKFDLFCVAMNADANLAALETLSIFNKGSLYVSSTKAGLKRKLGKLIKAIQHPIGKNLSLHACTRFPEQNIRFVPKNRRLGTLYANTPFTVLGQTDSMEDFTLFLQGQHGKDYIQIHKEISFSQASCVTDSLEKQWALEHAVDAYHNFFFTQNKAYAKQAVQYLENHNIPTFFP